MTQIKLPEYKLLVVGDTPTVFTGFGCVNRNLITQWEPFFARIDVWGINHTGWPTDYPHRIYPGGTGDWNGDLKLSQLLQLIQAGDFTHVFILGDMSALARGKFPRYLRQACDSRNVHLTYYFPVDAQLNPAWIPFLSACDESVTYTEYGLSEVRVAGYKGDVSVIPHGVNTEFFYPVENRAEVRARLLDGIDPDDFIIVNVNRNERRKAPLNTIQIVKRLYDMGMKVRCLLHMPDQNKDEQISLKLAMDQCGLPEGVCFTNDKYFLNGNGTGFISDERMNDLYQAADLCITTSLGEGWGLSATEALAAGCPLAAPLHTSLKEIVELAREHKMNAHGLPVSRNGILNVTDHSRVRFPVEVEESAQLIWELHNDGTFNRRPVMPQALRDVWSWKNSAMKFLDLMGIDSTKSMP